jgi:dTDP-4-dehydrorhamnose reductase
MNNLKILLFGRNGQLGWELQRTLAPLGKVTAVDQEDLDLVNQAELRSLILELIRMSMRRKTPIT